MLTYCPVKKRNNSVKRKIPSFSIFSGWKYVSSWSSCNVTCGGGTMQRRRECQKGGVPIEPSACGGGPTTVSLRCNTHLCAGMVQRKAHLCCTCPDQESDASNSNRVEHMVRLDLPGDLWLRIRGSNKDMPGHREGNNYK